MIHTPKPHQIKMPTIKPNPRTQYLHQQKLRVEASPALALQFKTLKSLTVDLGFYNPEGQTRSSQIKYKVNLEHARSVFRFACLNHECVCGDFDLSEVLATAVAAKRKTVIGEMHCPGWRSRSLIESQTCNNLLRYKLTLAFSPLRAPSFSFSPVRHFAIVQLSTLSAFE